MYSEPSILQQRSISVECFMSIKAESKAPEIEAFFDHDSNTVSYVVTDVAMKKRDHRSGFGF